MQGIDPFINPENLTVQSPETILREYWGYSAFRPLQREIIECILSGRDCLALLPTGGGKSICYQVPALLMDGLTLVISPLIALMRDQVQQLRERSIDAEAIYSGMHISEIDRILDNCIYGKTKLLYLSPERIITRLAEDRIRRMNVSLIAVDEAHCVSQWGYDFRPSYLEIVKLREWHPETPWLALTASATPPVQTDIVRVLELREPEMIKGSFRRPNLSYLVFPREDKWQRMLDILGKLPGSKLVYTRSRSKASQLAKQISKYGIRCEAYHAGLPGKLRNQVQQRWIEGATGTVVCTTAFGMGIDKSDVRAVIHYDLPGSLEEYYQEAGRAGRDGKKSFCVLLYDQSDLPQLKDRCVRTYPDVPDMIRVYRALCGHYTIPVGGGEGGTFDLDFRQFSTKYQLEPVHAYHCLKGLERDGWILLSEAVHHPSTVQISASHEVLETFQQQNPDLGHVLRTMLRNYEGLFLEPVRVRESEIARLLQTKENDVVEQLMQLDKEGIVVYTPANQMPRVTFLRERVEDRNLTFDTTLITHLRNQANARMHSVAEYITGGECREQYILSYFGEEPEISCGSCDICRSVRKRVSIDTILLRIPETGIILKDLVASFGATNEPEVRELISILESEEFIVLEHDLVRLRK